MAGMESNYWELSSAPSLSEATEISVYIMMTAYNDVIKLY